jgi:hypothetical protein
VKVGDLIRLKGSKRVRKVMGIVLSEPYNWSSVDGLIVVDVRFFGKNGLTNITQQYTIDQLEVIGESRRSC